MPSTKATTSKSPNAEPIEIILIRNIPHVKASMVEGMIHGRLYHLRANHGREWFHSAPELMPLVLQTFEEAEAMPDFRVVLREKRLERNLTQEEAAKAMRISQEMLAQIESGARSPSSATHDKITRWLSGPPGRPRSVKGPYNKDRSTIPHE